MACQPPAGPTRGRCGSRPREVQVDTGMVRKIDDLGRIVVPAETRRLLGIREGDELSISVDGSNIVIRKLETTCVFDGSTENVRPFLGRGICARCLGIIRDDGGQLRRGRG